MPLTSSSGDWNIRKAKADDAEALVDLFNRLGHETDFMLFEPGERNITVEEEAKRLESWEAASSGVVLLPAVHKSFVSSKPSAPIFSQFVETLRASARPA